MRSTYFGTNMRRIYLLILILGLGASLVISGACAQSSSCNQSMITGSWVFTDPTGEAGPGFGSGLACIIAISSTGAMESSVSSCNIAPNTFDSFVPMTGSLTIHPSCKVTGKITWSVTTSGARLPTQTFSFTSNLTLWRSLDGSRLTGYELQALAVTCADYCGVIRSNDMIGAEFTLISQPP
jgi:hypothetical protein